MTLVEEMEVLVAMEVELVPVAAAAPAVEEGKVLARRALAAMGAKRGGTP